MDINPDTQKQALIQQFVGGMMEMMGDPKLFYKSAVGTKHIYSGWTDIGQQVVLDYVQDFSCKLLVVQEKILHHHAKSLTFQTLQENVKNNDQCV